MSRSALVTRRTIVALPYVGSLDRATSNDDKGRIVKHQAYFIHSIKNSTPEALGKAFLTPKKVPRIHTVRLATKLE